jgi:hypothetical protein
VAGLYFLPGQQENMRPYFATATAITKDGMLGARTFFHIPDSLGDEALIDNSIARRLDAATAK